MKKENKNYKVFQLTIICFVIYFVTSLFALLFNFNWEPFKNINLVADIINTKSTTDFEKQQAYKKDELVEKVDTTDYERKDFELYNTAATITDFKVYQDHPALLNVAEKLANLEQKSEGKIRIAYFGDSIIEGDLLTEKLRELLQNRFGGNGVGFLPVYSEIYGFRRSAKVYGEGWEDANFVKRNNKNIYISGHTFTGTGTTIFKDNTVKNKSALIEKSLLFGPTNNALISVNRKNKTITGQDLVNREQLIIDSLNKFTLRSKSATTPIYGVNFESEDGVFVDNFPFRNVTGSQLIHIKSETLDAIHKHNNYDLIVFQYGVNLLFRPKDTDYSYYGKEMIPIVQKFKQAFPNTDFLIVGSSDRAFRYNGEFKTAIGLPNLIRTQAKIAFENDIAFYNQFETMGGENTMVDWVNRRPSLANRDHVHPNKKGANILAENLFQAIIKDYNKYSQNNLDKH